MEPSSIQEYKLRCIFDNPVENKDEGSDFGTVYPEEKAKRIPEVSILTKADEHYKGKGETMRSCVVRVPISISLVLVVFFTYSCFFLPIIYFQESYCIIQFCKNLIA